MGSEWSLIIGDWINKLFRYLSLDANEDIGSTDLVVYQDGSVLWVPPAIFKVACSKESGKYICPFKVGQFLSIITYLKTVIL